MKISALQPCCEDCVYMHVCVCVSVCVRLKIYIGLGEWEQVSVVAISSTILGREEQWACVIREKKQKNVL